MRILRYVAVAMLATLPTIAEAGVYGSVLFNVSSMNIQRSTSQFGTFTTVGAGAATVSATGIVTKNTAELLGIGDIAQPGGPDPLQAFVTSGAEVAPGQNDFSRTVPVPATSAFARADQLTTGSLLDTTNGLTTQMVAEIEASDASLGGAGAGSAGFAIFEINVAQDGWYRLEFDTLVDMVVSSIGPPALRTAFASTNLSIQINGLVATLDNPGLISTSLSGTGSIYEAQTGVTTGAVFLGVQAAPHVLTITQQATVELEAVPEPSSILAFAGIVVAGGFSRLRRRQIV